ncbi:hypothetical protein SAMN05428642_103192 [Flaviramulus basaltis]|uniref:Uncharacterized protein n=1 Tax=Flaviramulus basaltis TaxID=369401 RepID=A0A1K2IM58_9FLAO|nr:hypothetical protein [Flaviramulus basaltis]SFZ93540.1 hypothetical protein SAMN05428642_103192 [Flaviramulus basaltis]
MEWKSNPKNENLTIRITKNEKLMFKYLARTNRTSQSNWAHHILCKHKHSYNKIEYIDLILESLEIAKEGLEFNYKLLEDQIRTTDRSLSKFGNLLLLKMKVLQAKMNLEKVQNKILNSRV